MALHGRSSGPKIVNDSAGTALSAVSKTASFDTAWVSCAGAQYISWWIVADETAGSGTFDVDVECTPDNGTTVFEMPQALDSETVAEFGQFTGDINTVMTWQLPACGPDSDFKVRLEFTAASSPTFSFTVYYSLFYPS
jgi:hypothetical protein